MKRMLFNATYAEELRVAAVEGQKLINFDIETSSKEQRRGNIYKGVITRVEPSLEACFVDYGTEKQGFLPYKEIDFRHLPEVNGQRGRDFNRLPEGTELIVQVEKDERGNKGAALTSYVTLPGRYLVLMPNNSRAGGISRRIEGEERDELKSLMSQLEVPQGMSVILRTAALGRVIEELQWDLTYLLKLWSAIGGAAEEQKGSFLIYQESSLVIRSIRDHFSPDISEVLIDTEEVYQQARQFMSHVMPNFAERIKLYRDDVPLFSRFQIEHQIESAYSRTVNLPSGGAIVIDHTEALTSVDVNSAKANKGADIEATAFATNIEAAEEIARQLRLRDLGGLVVVDYIDMENPRNQRDLENHFKFQLGLDRARIQMGKLSKFGLLELSRQRLQASLDESSTIACPRCAGVGSIRGIESTALHVLRIVQEETIKYGNNLSALQVQLPVDVATYLLNERRDDVAKIEARMKVKIILIPNIHLDSPNYRIKKVGYENQDSGYSRSSYNMVEMPEENLGYKPMSKRPEASINKIPVVSNIGPVAAPVIEARKGKSLFAEIVKKIATLFATNPPASAPKGRTVQSSSPSARNLKPRYSENSVNQQRGPNERQSVTASPQRERVSAAQNPNQVSTGNKSRHVAVSKSNTRVQTVRPVQSSPAAANKPTAPYAAPVKAERQPRQTATHNPGGRNLEAPGRNNDSSLRNEASTRNPEAHSATKNEAPSNRRPAPQPEIAVKPAAVAQFNGGSGDKLNVADKSVAAETIFASSVSGGVVVTVIDKVKATAAQPEVAAKPQAAAKERVVEVVKPLIRPKALVAEPINLGELQMVATKTDLLKQPQVIPLSEKVKRYSDLVIKEKSVEPNVAYEQVETKL